MSDHQQGLPDVVPVKPAPGPIVGLVVEPGLRPEPSTGVLPALLEVVPVVRGLEMIASPGFMPEL